MLAVSPLRSTTATTKDERGSEMEGFPMGCHDDFPDFTGGNLLDSIDFDDLFVGIHDGDVLPDLEMDPEVLAEFSISGGEEYSDTTTTANNSTNATATSVLLSSEKVACAEDNKEAENLGSSSNSGSDLGSGLTSLNQGGEEILSKRDENTNPSPKENYDNNKGKKSSAQSKNNPQGKRKVKVDWTPELHRRFVQAVEQLGVDKAVPSRILELMGIDCLTRHNIASHLQKYRSHRKHLLAREAEAANWSQRRQMYGGAAAGGGGGGGKREMSPWLAPTMGFPPPPMPHFRPLHVWGHPSVDQSLMHNMWPKHHQLAASTSPPPPAWPAAAPPPPPPLTDPSFWHSHHQRVATPCFPAPIAPARFPAPPVPGIPPPAMYKLDPGIGVPTAPAAAAQPLPRPPFDFHPSKESIDAAIGDVLSKPWLPLPLGLKPPSTDTVMVELQRQGISKVPPSCA